MALPEYKNFEKCVKDLIADDYDTKIQLKTKSEGPADISITTTTEYSAGTAVFPSKVNLKWAHKSGFAVDKFEMSSCDKATLETSLSGVVEGLKLDFKGTDATNGVVGSTYKHKLATVTSELDVSGFSYLKASLLGGSNGVLAGASANFALGNKFAVNDYSAAFGWKPNDNIFVGLKANNKLADLNSYFLYQLKPNVGLHGQLDFTPKTSQHALTVGASYKCCESTSMKTKVNTSGLVNASVKKNFPNKLAVVGAVGLDVHKLDSVNFGVTATLG
jgi:hypothetical protein